MESRKRLLIICTTLIFTFISLILIFVFRAPDYIPVDNNYTLGDYPYFYEIIAGVLSSLITLMGSYVIATSSIVKKYIWYHKFNSIRWGHNLTTKGHRKFTFVQNMKIDYNEFKKHVLFVVENLDINEYRAIEQQKKLYPPLIFNFDFSGTDFLINADLVVNPIIDPPSVDTLNPQISGINLALIIKHKWKMIDTIPGKLDRILRTFGQCLERSLKSDQIRWSIPTLEISPVPPFVKDSFWLRQVATRSTINLTLDDMTKISLTPDAIVVRKHSKVPNEFKTFDDHFIYYLKQAVATFYSSSSK